MGSWSFYPILLCAHKLFPNVVLGQLRWLSTFNHIMLTLVSGLLYVTGLLWSYFRVSVENILSATLLNFFFLHDVLLGFQIGNLFWLFLNEKLLKVFVTRFLQFIRIDIEFQFLCIIYFTRQRVYASYFQQLSFFTSPGNVVFIPLSHKLGD